VGKNKSGTQCGSCVFLSALDASNAFDHVDHRILFQKLIEHNNPQCFIGIIQNWYHFKLTAVVRWHGMLSYNFYVSCGARQSGVLSPLVFNVYVDDLLCQLELRGLGCCIENVYLGCAMYA